MVGIDGDGVVGGEVVFGVAEVGGRGQDVVLGGGLDFEVRRDVGQWSMSRSRPSW